MDRITSFSEIAPYLSNPLVLVGFVLLLFFGVHRTLVRSGLLPPVSQRQSSIIVKVLLRYGFIIALIVIVLGFGATYFNTYISKVVEKHTELSLVDLVLEDELSFDFKLKNSGTDTAFLTQVRFVFYPGSGVLSICMPVWYELYEFPFSAELGDQIVSVSDGNRLPEDYSLQREAESYAHEKRFVAGKDEKPYLITKPLKISQAVPPGGVDRFKIRFNIDPKYSNAFFSGGDTCRWSEVYEAHAIITYDGEKELITPKFQLGYVPSQYTEKGLSLNN